MRKILKYFGFISLITSYAFLILTFIADFSETADFNLFYLSWGLGILSLISNAIYAIKIGIKGWIFSIFGFCGLMWFALPFVSDSFGIASLTIFLVIGIYIHIQPNIGTEKTA